METGRQRQPGTPVPGTEPNAKINQLEGGRSWNGDRTAKTTRQEKLRRGKSWNGAPEKLVKFDNFSTKMFNLKV